jgi:peptide/nickel transport system permease protein
MPVRYLVRRLLMLVLVVWTAATINFFLPKLSPRDPIMERLQQAAFGGGRQQSGLQEMVKSYQRDFGLDKPLWQQYLRYLGGVTRFDFGYSLAQYPRKVTDVIADALPWTIGLAFATTLIAFAIGTILGALIAWPRSPKFFRYLIPPLMTLSAIPFYMFALILIYFFAFRWRIFPLAGAYSRGAVPQFSMTFILDLLKHALLPGLAIVLVSIGGWALSMRGLMVMIQGEDYITFAEAKGLKPGRIFLRYALRNAMLPQMTGLLLSLGYIIFGTALVETVFGYPGLGSLIGSSIQTLDYFTIYGVVMILVIAISLATLAMDLLYPLLDPRVKYERG